MATNLEDKWETIAAAAIHEAERVDCSLSDFAAGLKSIEQDIRDRRQLAEDEARNDKAER